jgi:hypothetical protein
MPLATPGGVAFVGSSSCKRKLRDADRNAIGGRMLDLGSNRVNMLVVAPSDGFETFVHGACGAATLRA